MPKKIPKTNLDFNPSSLFENLAENEKATLLSECSMIFSHSAFQSICNELSTREVLNTIEEAETIERLHFGRGKLAGISEVFETIRGYHIEHQQSTKKEEPFDPHEVI